MPSIDDKLMILPSPPLDHVRQDRMGGEEDALDVDGEDPIPFGLVELL